MSRNLFLKCVPLRNIRVGCKKGKLINFGPCSRNNCIQTQLCKFAFPRKMQDSQCALNLLKSLSIARTKQPYLFAGPNCRGHSLRYKTDFIILIIIMINNKYPTFASYEKLFLQFSSSKPTK